MWRAVLIGLVASMLSSCDVILDELYDCLDDDGPVFNTSQLPVAVLNQYYSYAIVASIDNQPDDDRFNYTISLYGRLPDGLSMTRVGVRTIYISGIPTESGVFNIRLTVDVTDPYSSTYQVTNVYDDGDDLCRTTHGQDYNLIVSSS